jgi:hypothetical protein
MQYAGQRQFAVEQVVQQFGCGVPIAQLFAAVIAKQFNIGFTLESWQHTFGNVGDKAHEIITAVFEKGGM